MPPVPQRPPFADLDARLAAVAHIALRGANEVTRLAAETHATIARAPLPWDAEGTAHARQAPFPYRLVGHGFLLLARFSQMFLKGGPLASPETRGGRLFQSALNGVLGDKLAQWNSPLAEPMSLCDTHGSPLPADWPGQGGAGVVVFIHGLCLSDQNWQNEAHQDFVNWLESRGQRVAWLRYNTGRSIHENGEALHALLEARFGQKKAPALTLIGHSMGGLLIRSASHAAEQAKARWLGHLRNAAYLGSPHQGAPLERLGNSANRLLGLTPYSKPFMRLGNIRSEGIRDLRHGSISSDGARNLPLPSHVRHYLVAGSLHASGKHRWLGDGLVPVRSALGQHVDETRALNAPHISRYEFTSLGHMAMLGDSRVYSGLREWLERKH